MSGKRLRRGWLANESGSSAIEFAIALPALVLLLAGLGQYAWTQHCASSLRYALSSSSRNLLLNPTMSEAAYTALVKSKLTAADPNVGVSLVVVTTGGRKVATAKGTYARSIDLLMLPAIPIHYSTTVVTSLPAF